MKDTEQAPRWPRPPTVGGARSALSAWARRDRLVPDELFYGELAVRDATIAKLVTRRLVRQAREATVTVPGPPPPLPAYRDLDEVAPPAGRVPHDWVGAREGSLATLDCQACAGKGVSGCAACGGAGVLPCPPRQRCRRCHGTGRLHTSHASEDTVECGRCRGTGRVACSRCRGAGQLPCAACQGRGWSTCTTCQGHGLLSRYVRGEIRYQTVDSHLELGDPGRFGRRAERHYRRVGLLSEDRPVTIEGLPAEVRAAADGELARHVAGQARCEVEVLALPAAEVTWQDGSRTRTAVLLGDEPAVRAPGARRLGAHLLPW